MVSFAHTLNLTGYVPGFIGNTDSSKNFNFDRQCSHYVLATREQNGYYAIYGAAEPKIDGEVQKWNPYCPSALQPNDIKLWMTENMMFDELLVNILYAKDKTILENTWEG